MTGVPADGSFRFHIIIDPSRIIYLNSLLDSYEGIGMMRTADENLGEIIVYTTEGQAEYVCGLLESLKAEGVRLEIIKTDLEDEVS